MFRSTIDVGPATDVDAVLASLVRDSEAAGLAQPDVELLRETTGDVLRTLCTQGQQLAAHGSQMSVSREVEGRGYHIKLRYRSTKKRGLLARLLGG
jgi:hypothetical protein